MDELKISENAAEILKNSKKTAYYLSYDDHVDVEYEVYKKNGDAYEKQAREEFIINM